MTGAMNWGALSSVAGGKPSGRLRAEHGIGWALVASLPVTAPETFAAHAQPHAASESHGPRRDQEATQLRAQYLAATAALDTGG